MDFWHIIHSGDLNWTNISLFSSGAILKSKNFVLAIYFQNMVTYLFSSTQFLVISMFSDPEGLLEKDSYSEA